MGFSLFGVNNTEDPNATQTPSPYSFDIKAQNPQQLLESLYQFKPTGNLFYTGTGGGGGSWGGGTTQDTSTVTYGGGTGEDAFNAPKQSYPGGSSLPGMGQMISDAQKYGLFQNIPDFDTGDFDKDYEKAIGSFTNLQNTLMGLHPQALAELQRTYASGRAGIEEGRQRRAGEIERAGTTAGERAENAINRIRSESAELQQGIQSRFGGQTGTGAFSGELAGREAFKQIGAQRQQLEQSMRELQAASQDLEREVSTRIFQLDTELINAKSELERDLRTRLAEIETDKGMLRADKAKAKLGALTDYRNLVAQIESNNAGVKQSLYSEYLKEQRRIDDANQYAWLLGQGVTGQESGLLDAILSAYQGDAYDPRLDDLFEQVEG